MIKTLLFYYYLFLSVLSLNIYSQSITWTETQPAGDADKRWYTTSMSSDGTNLIVGEDVGRLYISTNGGSSWTETQPAGDADKRWYTTSMSSDGNKLIAGEYMGRLYISTNGGGNWSETQPVGNNDGWWSTTSMSSDGNKLIAGEYLGRLYISTNGGDSWSETQPAGDNDKIWQTYSMSSDGTKLIAGEIGRLYISTNGGVGWVETQPAGDADKAWYSTSMSSNGTKLIAGVSPGRLYISTNSGSSWSETQPAGASDEYWMTTSMSSDGTKLIAGVSPGRLYISTNDGNSWTETRPAGDADKYWSTTSASSDGTKTIVGVRSGRLYLNNELLPVELTSFSFQVNDYTVTLNWSTATEINNYGFDIECRSKDGSYEKIGFINGGGNSNSPKSYSFIDNSVNSGVNFYRLRQIDTDGGFKYSKEIEVIINKPTEFSLAQNFPNPFNPTTKIKYSIPNSEKVLIIVYDVMGKEVKTLLNEFKDSGTYEIEFDGNNLVSGLYFYKIIAGSYTGVKKMILMR